ncbi:ParA family protein [Thermostaphylospora chromogena]|uniref:ParA family protein n=1 Tax=Thermostaphylospora chromogena TaxID=35622 RepID=UPI000A8AB1D5|nr:AAA family ATPase [Thermostaphylospora chromogena]
MIAVANDKGGVGKTSITANLSALYATAGYRVLALDLNRQANLSDDLGYRGSPVDDQGAACSPRYWPVNRCGRYRYLGGWPRRRAGGVALGDLTGVMVGRVQQRGRQAFGRSLYHWHPWQPV